MSSIKKEIKPEWQVFIDICLKSSDELRQFLNMEEGGRLVIGSSHYHTRDFYIYHVLDEIEKVGMCLMRYADDFGDDESHIKSTDDRLSRNLITAIVDEQSLWLRKLQEILMAIHLS